MIIYPDSLPKYHNNNREPCDMLDGPCVCGAWHSYEEWVDIFNKHGTVDQLPESRDLKSL
jgi:hypothetical protein